MGVLISDADIASVRAMYPYLDIKPLTTQEEQLLFHHLRGATVSAAARVVGMARQNASAFFNTERAKRIIEQIRQDHFEEIRVSRDSITAMLMASHAKAATATEEIAAAVQLGKLHNVFENEIASQQAKANKNITVNDRTPRNGREITDMTNEQLERLFAGATPAEIVDETNGQPLPSPATTEVEPAETLHAEPERPDPVESAAVDAGSPEGGHGRGPGGLHGPVQQPGAVPDA